MFSDRLTIAVFKLIAKGDLGMVEQFAKATIEDYFKGPYRPFLDKGDPIQAIKKFIELRDSLYNFSDTSVEVTGEKGLRVRIFNLGQVGEGIDVFISFLSVQFKEMIALNGDKDIAVDSRLFDEKGQSIVEFDLSWS